ncbi:hypothetical protein [Desulfobulbus propionicus]|uniref:hypothetical protein n=1 Tax=Desulfobulbus propionicus TaxID=894 RepID=UPI001C54E3EE|nr:hypothetical protein [Desulfobulbus propionicus]
MVQQAGTGEGTRVTANTSIHPWSEQNFHSIPCLLMISMPWFRSGFLAKGLAGNLAKYGMLIGDTCLVQLRLHAKEALIQQGFWSADSCSSQEDIPMSAADVDITGDIVGYPSDEIDDGGPGDVVLDSASSGLAGAFASFAWSGRQLPVIQASLFVSSRLRVERGNMFFSMIHRHRTLRLCLIAPVNQRNEKKEHFEVPHTKRQLSLFQGDP